MVPRDCFCVGAQSLATNHRGAAPSSAAQAGEWHCPDAKAARVASAILALLVGLCGCGSGEGGGTISEAGRGGGSAGSGVSEKGGTAGGAGWRESGGDDAAGAAGRQALAGASSDEGTAGAATGGASGVAGDTGITGGASGIAGDAGITGGAENGGGAGSSGAATDGGGAAGASVNAGSAGGGDIAGSSGAAGDENDASPLGINLASVTYYSRQWTFLDLTKVGGSFGYAADPGSEDADGWVLSGDVGLFLNTGLEGHYPGGRYVVLYDGAADLFTRPTIWDADGSEMPNDAVLDSERSVPGRAVMDVSPSNSGFVLSYENISAAEPLRNLRIVHEDFEDTYATEIFHPKFTASIERFSTLRFMDMMRTNGSTQQEWSERPLPTDALQGTDKGVALEYLIALANRAGADPWFTIPHLASDEYVESFALLVRDELDPSLRPYVEYSNEVWNSGFEQSAYATSMGEAAGLGEGRDAADRYYARRSVEIFEIFERVFAQTSRTGLVRVLASQTSPYWAMRLMDWVDPSTGRATIEEATYWALAPYFCGEPPESPASVHAVLDVCEASVQARLGDALEIANHARASGVQVIAYEGGQHIRNDNASAATQTLYNLANDDPRMGELYTQYLNGWRQTVGGQTFALFSLVSGQGTTGRWGILKEQDDFDYPKYQAAMSFITDNPIWW